MAKYPTNQEKPHMKAVSFISMSATIAINICIYKHVKGNLVKTVKSNSKSI